MTFAKEFKALAINHKCFSFYFIQMISSQVFLIYNKYNAMLKFAE